MNTRTSCSSGPAASCAHALTLWAALLCVAGCGGGAASRQAAESGTPPPAAPDTLAARLFDPAQDTVVSGLVAAWPQAESAGDGSNSQGADSDDEATDIVYRVQLFTTKDLSTAQTVRREAEKDFAQSVQIDYEIPYYKVRVGSFASPQAAEPLLQEARRLGYRGAWAVRGRASEQAP